MIEDVREMQTQKAGLVRLLVRRRWNCRVDTAVVFVSDPHVRPQLFGPNGEYIYALLDYSNPAHKAFSIATDRLVDLS